MQRKLLVIDDDKDFLDSTKALLERHRFYVLTADPERPYESALKLKEEYPEVRAALVDLMMPSDAWGEGSVEVGLDLIKVLSNSIDFSVVVYSAFPESREEATSRGAKAFFVKSDSTPQELLACLEQLVGGQSAHRPTEAEQQLDRRDYELNRGRLSSADLEPYAGKCVAFAPDGSAILASAADWASLEEALTKTGLDPSKVVLEYIPEEDTLFGGAELL